jgi:hypothetical protein
MTATRPDVVKTHRDHRGSRVISWPPRRIVAERTARSVRTMFFMEAPVASWRWRETARAANTPPQPAAGKTI